MRSPRILLWHLPRMEVLENGVMMLQTLESPRKHEINKLFTEYWDNVCFSSKFV